MNWRKTLLLGLVCLFINIIHEFIQEQQLVISPIPLHETTVSKVKVKGGRLCVQITSSLVYMIKYYHINDILFSPPINLYIST